MRSTSEASSQPSLTECAEEFKACAEDFWYWCGAYCYIEDKESHGSVLFKPYECQRAMGDLMLQGKWILALKARRLGITWLVVAYAVWLVTFHPDRTAAILNQADEYAQDNLDRCRYILDRMPDWMQPRRTVDHKRRITFAHGCELRSFAPSTKSMRSLAADLVIADEAAYIDLLSECLGAAEPTVETSKGQIIVLSTSKGPSGKFYDGFQEAQAGKSKYTPLFFDWRSRPGRTEEWYEQEKKTHESDPLYIKREYPSTPEEAFESAEGRVYPMFVRSSVFVQRLAGDIKPQRFYRGVDWGGVDPFVCLWGCLVPGDGPGLTIDPSCENAIREALAYSYDESGKPQDKDNHAPDVIRYLVTGCNIVGHLHIYRELYIPESAARYDLNDLAKMILDMSKGERYEATIADRSRPDSMRLLGSHGIPCRGQPNLSGGRIGEIEQGIVRVNALIVGTAKEKGKEAMPRATVQRQFAGRFFG